MELVSLKQLFQRLNGGRLLGLDVGNRNVGLAISDPQCRIASPHRNMTKILPSNLYDVFQSVQAHYILTSESNPGADEVMRSLWQLVRAIIDEGNGSLHCARQSTAFGRDALFVLYRNQSTILKNISRLESLVEELNITGLVVGYPLELTGFQGKQGAQVKMFIKELELSGRFPSLSYVYWDERLTSVAVTNVIASMDIMGRRRKSLIDKMSALCILQGCLDSLSRLENGQMALD